MRKYYFIQPLSTLPHFVSFIQIWPFLPWSSAKCLELLAKIYMVRLENSETSGSFSVIIDVLPLSTAAYRET